MPESSPRSPIQPRPAAAPTTPEQVRALERKSVRGLFALALFLGISILALRGFSIFPDLPPGVRASLGPAPGATMISAALVLYSFSAIVLALARLGTATPAGAGWAHVAYLSTFYVFYHFSGSLADNAWAVVAAGCSILSLEAWRLYQQCRDEIRRLTGQAPPLEEND